MFVSGLKMLIRKEFDLFRAEFLSVVWDVGNENPLAIQFLGIEFWDGFIFFIFLL